MSEKQPDVIIIGGGVAGLSAAQYAARAGLKAHLFEELAPGGLLLNIDILENYPGYDKPISGFELADNLTKQAEQFGVEIHYSGIAGIERNSDGLFVVTTDDGFYGPRRNLSHGARGVSWGPERLNTRGRGLLPATCDGPFKGSGCWWLVEGTLPVLKPYF